MTFTSETLDFLGGLSANNDREWFTPRKAIYERSVKAPAEALVAALQPRLEELAGEPLKGRIHRIYRDTRFSKDKRPYNPYVRVGWMPLGEGRHRPGWYLSLESGKYWAGVGVFDLESQALDAYRAAAADERSGAALSALLTRFASAGVEPLDEPPLKRVPAPYPQDHPRGALLRRKGLTVWWQTTDPGQMVGPGLIDLTVTKLRELAPLNAWLEDALS